MPTGEYSVNRHNIRDSQFVSEEGVELVRRALRRGLTRETSIQRWTNLHWVEVSAAIRILLSKGEIIPKGGNRRWWGVSEETMAYRERRNREMIEPRKHRGRPRREMMVTSISKGLFMSMMGKDLAWSDMRYRKEKRRRRH